MLLLSIPAAYILVMGPLTFCYEKFDPKGTSPIWNGLEHAYRPLGPFISGSSTVGAKALRTYLNLWLENDIPEPADFAFPAGL